MHLRLRWPSPAMVVALVALFVALGGTSYAVTRIGTKQLKNNAVTSPKIRNGHVRTADIGDGQVASRDIGDGQVGSGDIGDGQVGGADLAGNSVDSAKVPDNALTAGDIDGGSLDGEVGPDAFVRVAANGTPQPNVAGFPPQVKGVDSGDIVKGEGGAATGNYCFGGLDFRPATAMVSLDNADAAAADRNLVASVAIDRGEDLGDCPSTHNQARVRIVDGNTGAAQDARFFIWFER